MGLDMYLRAISYHPWDHSQQAPEGGSLSGATFVDGFEVRAKFLIWDTGASSHRCTFTL